MKKNRNNRENSVRTKLRSNSTHAYKDFGQNFLHDKILAQYMVDSLEIKPADFVIEIGPGMGALTELIIKNEQLSKSSEASAQEEIKNKNEKPKFLGVEIDLEKIIYLKQTFPDIDIWNGSVLDFNVEEQLAKNNIEDYKIIGSLPFNISKKIIQNFSECEKRPSKAVFMVQKEVGDNYAPEKKDGTTFLSIYISEFWEIIDKKLIPRESFYPIPKVHGLVLVMTPRFEPDYKFIKFAKIGFSRPRKKLGNIIQLNPEDKFYNKRPHELTISEWKELYSIKNNELMIEN